MTRRTSIVYVTNRKDPRIHWFIHSLLRELKGDTSRVQVLCVAFYHAEVSEAVAIAGASDWLKVIPPKPCAWQGPHRLTSKDWFSASNARNTGIAAAEGDTIAFVDDLSVLGYGWFEWVEYAAENQCVCIGVYEKVRELVCRVGAKEFEFYRSKTGSDTRLPQLPQPVRKSEAYPCGGEWLYGASMACPINFLLDINGFDEDCNGMGSEDYIAGLMLEHQGRPLFLCPGMKTFEDEDLHHFESPFPRINRGEGENDASWTVLKRARDGGMVVANTWFNLRELRSHILGGGEFPTDVGPETWWYDGTPLKDIYE